MSRKKQVYEKITALYCRISLDDGGDNESMSISNQKLMLRDFAEKHGMFQYEYYVDDGYTGRNFNRPSFQRMIADIEAGKVGCVVTKDLSRLGRNYIEAGSYIEIFFPKHNVRYIAITDGVDSLTRQEMDITPFKNILNDMYSRDISKKVLAGRMTLSLIHILSKYEKETIINWNEGETIASIYTFNASLKRRLEDFSRKYPLLCRLESSTPVSYTHLDVYKRQK